MVAGGVTRGKRMSGEVVAPSFECTSALPINVMVGEGTNSMLASRRVQPHAPYRPWPLAALQATKWSAKRRASEEPMAVRRSEVAAGASPCLVAHQP